jgi:hypothetical protein
MPIRRAGAHCRRLLESGRLTLIDHWDYSKYEFALETAPQSGERCVADAYFEARQLPFIFSALSRRRVSYRPTRIGRKTPPCRLIRLLPQGDRDAAAVA